MKVKVTRMTSGRSSTRPGLLTLSLVVAATSAVLLIGSASSEPSPSPFVDVGRFVERLPPLVRRLLSPTRTSRQHQQQAKSLPDAAAAASSFQRKTGELEAEVVVDDSVAPPAAGKNETAVRDDSAGSQEQVKRDGSSAGVGGGVNATDSDEMGAKTEAEAKPAYNMEESWWWRLFGVPSPLAIIRGDVAATKQIFDVGDLPNLLDVLRRGGIDFDLTNQRVTIDTTLLITEGVIIAVPIVITALIMGYFWIVFGLVEFDYTVFGQYPKVVPNTIPGAYSRMDVVKETFNMFKHAYGKYSKSPSPSTFPASEMPSRTPVYVPSKHKKNKGDSRTKTKVPSANNGVPEGFFDVNDNTVKRRRLRVSH